MLKFELFTVSFFILSYRVLYTLIDILINIYRKNSFVEISKNLTRYKSENNVEYLNINNNAAKSFNILATDLNILHNYFDSPIKLLSVKILDN